MNNEEMIFTRNVVVGILIFLIVFIGAVFSIKYVFGNKQLIDMKYNFNTAYVSYPDGKTEKIEIKMWKDYDNSDSIQIVDVNGKPYFTHLNRVILTKE